MEVSTLMWVGIQTCVWWDCVLTQTRPCVSSPSRIDTLTVTSVCQLNACSLHVNSFKLHCCVGSTLSQCDLHRYGHIMTRTCQWCQASAAFCIHKRRRWSLQPAYLREMTCKHISVLCVCCHRSEANQDCGWNYLHIGSGNIALGQFNGSFYEEGR